MEKVKYTSNDFIPFEEIREEKKYRRFIKWALNFGDTICVTCEGASYEKFLESAWENLGDSILDYEYTNKTPVTLSFGETFLLLYLKVDEVTERWIKSKSNIYDFGNDGNGNDIYLWDLCLCKNGEVFFYSCTHEEFCEIDEKVLERYEEQT